MSHSNMVRIEVKNTSASGNRESWLKLVTKVDTTKQSGYAFEGTFLKEGVREVPAWSILVSKIPTGSVKNGFNIALVEYVDDEGERHELKNGGNWEANFLAIRDAVVKSFQTVKEIQAKAVVVCETDNHTELLAERDALLARLAVIDSQLSAFIA